jgi:leucyl-tRNA synthetase
MLAVQDLIGSESDAPKKDIDSWLISRFNNHLLNIRRVMDKNDLRAMTTIVYYDMFNDMKWYNRRGGNNRETITEALKIWIQCMMPVTPHIAEELWEQAGFEGLVSSNQLPIADETKISVSAEYGENLLRDVMSDITEIRKIAGIEVKKIVLYTSAQWKKDVMNLTKACMAREDLRKNGKAVSSLAQKVAVEFQRSTVEQKLPVVETDETRLFSDAAAFLSEENGVPVEVYFADAEGIYDPQGKAKVAIPGRPAIYLE